ncbi:MAG: phosphatase PAP2 family protein [Sulfurovum sp.]|nr:phosphatase PAP2 family protein [Sulfurovum sp.]
MQKKRLLLMINLLSLLLFFSMLVIVLCNAWLIELDRWISSHMHLVRIEWLNPVVEWVTHINGLIGAAIFSVIVIAFFARRRWYADIGFFILVTAGATGLFVLVKMLVGRVRPDAAIIEVGGYSFPSGHTTMATAMAFSLYFILSEKTQEERLRSLLLLLAFGWAVLIASTRLYLGVHWFTDVMGGFGLGLWWVTLLQLFRKAR